MWVVGFIPFNMLGESVDNAKYALLALPLENLNPTFLNYRKNSYINGLHKNS